MTKIINLLCSIGILALPLYHLPSSAQTTNNTVKETSDIYENDRIKFVLQQCNRKQEDLICQGTLTSKKNDRQIELNLTAIKIVDFDGNEYYPNSLRLANRSSENNSIKTELVGNIAVKTIVVFPKVPTSVNKIALLQIPLDIEQDTAIAKFRNLAIVGTNSGKDKTKPKSSATATNSNANSNNEPTLICPETTKILYRAATKDDLLFICGAKNPTYFVSQAKDGSQGMTLRLRYYDKKRFSADNGAVNYAIVGNKFTVTKNGKVISQEKISVLQPLAGSTATNPDPKPKQPGTTPSKVTKKSVKLRSGKAEATGSSETATSKKKPTKLQTTPTKKKTLPPSKAKTTTSNE